MIPVINLTKILIIPGHKSFVWSVGPFNLFTHLTCYKNIEGEVQKYFKTCISH